MFKPRTTGEWLFCGVLIIQAVIVLSLETFTLVQWSSWVHPNIIQVTISYITPLNLGILMFACVYLTALGLDAIYHKNDVLLLAICASNTCGLVYSAMQYRNIRQTIHRLPLSFDGLNQPFVDLDRDIWPAVKPAQLAAPIIIGLCTLLLWPLAYQLHCQFAWELYRSIHGNTNMKQRFRAYEIYIVLLKVDFYFIVGFILQYNLIDVHFDEPEYSLTMALIPVTLIVMVSGIYFARSERMIPMLCVTACYLGMIAYLLSRIIILCGNGLRARTAGKDMMILFASVALALTTLTIVSVIRCMLNFDRGLKHVLKPKALSPRGSYVSQHLSEHPPSPVHSAHSRMSID
ncbi:hypothetical protein P170DRAFT_443720 [Aspergillus steynii IBT 23096]|uniref:Uncharacterized protein n=1 Tax=Aspergillus steynii IBT 23096 TaxID=1392250 RepID=A0A2I2GF83_9EURO|nr:uncharacterized protein P170DRAFT_443720 [Aspergillus steynii IBT 23096]PLB51521.1 hypothetical protein P170DRAFT_443720 [Aspergillus steynii IBT 23096]